MENFYDKKKATEKKNMFFFPKFKTKLYKFAISDGDGDWYCMLHRL